MCRTHVSDLIGEYCSDRSYGNSISDPDAVPTISPGAVVQDGHGLGARSNLCDDAKGRHTQNLSAAPYHHVRFRQRQLHFVSFLPRAVDIVVPH